MSRSLRIALLYTPLVTAGGGERLFLEELRSLRGLGHDVRALTFRIAASAFAVEGVRADDMELMANGRPALRVLALRRALERIRPDALVAHTSPELTWLATRGSSIPYLVCHDSPPFYLGAHLNPYMRSARYRRALAQVRDRVAGYREFAAPPRSPRARMAAELRTVLKHRALRDAAAVLVLSNRTREELRLLHGVEATVARGCLRAARLGGGERHRARPGPGPVLLSVCRLEPVKRVDLLVRSFALVHRQLPEARLVIVGSGPESDRLATLVRSLALDGSVHLAGFVPETELWRHYEAADVFVTPAMADFNLAPYEALAMGCRVVWTTEMEPEPEIAATGNVFAAEPTEEAFAAAIQDAFAAPAGRPPELRSLTWESRAEIVADLCRAARGAPAPRGAARARAGTVTR